MKSRFQDFEQRYFSRVAYASMKSLKFNHKDRRGFGRLQFPDLGPQISVYEQKKKKYLTFKSQIIRFEKNCLLMLRRQVEIIGFDKTEKYHFLLLNVDHMYINLH